MKKETATKIEAGIYCYRGFYLIAVRDHYDKVKAWDVHTGPDYRSERVLSFRPNMVRAKMAVDSLIEAQAKASEPYVRTGISFQGKLGKPIAI